MTDSAIFCLTALAVLCPPGPTNALLALSGATVGPYRSLSVLVSAVAGYGVTLVGVNTAFGFTIASSPVAQAALRVLAALYLAFLALSLWRTNRTQRAPVVTRARAFAVSCTNPKAFVLALVVIPMQASSYPLSLAMLCVLTLVVGFAWVLIGAAVARAGDERLTATVGKVTSVALAAFAAMLIVSAVPRNF